MRRGLAVIAALIVIGATSAPPAWFGFGYLYRPGAGNTPSWLEVIRVLPNGPAARAGVRPRDAITAMNGKPLRFRDDAEVLQFFAARRPGERLLLHIRRGTSAVDVTVVAEKAPVAAAQRWQENRDLLKRNH